MKFWLNVYLPHLSLECIKPLWSDQGVCAVVENDKTVAASPAAFERGVRIGMRAGGVAAVCPTIVIVERDIERERMVMNSVSLALLQFTPEVANARDSSLLLDVTASLTLFHGRSSICRHVQASMRALGVTAKIGSGPTAMGAWLLSRWRPAKRLAAWRRTAKMETLERRLDRLPCELLPAAAPFLIWLAGIGAGDLGALRRLPRQGVMRRMSKQVLDELDRAYGLAPELMQWIAVPETFAARVETFDRVEQADALLAGATSLITQLIGWLTARQKALSVFSLYLEHERGRAAIAPTEIEIGLAEPTWRPEHLIRLLKERLGRIELSAPVIALRLEVKLLTDMAPPTDSLFAEPGGTPEDFNRLLELLCARLGKENVLSPQQTDDHRPEVCNAWTPATNVRTKPVVDNEEVSERPFWLLPKPIALLMRDERPFYGSPLRMLKGPERVEAGWWNDQLAARDYYIAQGSDATCYWIYLERTAGGRWHLHGIFA
jgi:protein ImuB